MCQNDEPEVKKKKKKRNLTLYNCRLPELILFFFQESIKRFVSMIPLRFRPLLIKHNRGRGSISTKHREN